ncbi:transcriptional regulator, XRE family [Roseovarius nanhaiticus]|uniref:Transcriptional regulator, XRE family n=1 Tax=Roseovarius nanhaiticus TaxID=573024 RepID=A0A1N7HHM5_9RHOB|nr:helix-turn-helix transcriptional regulator [Roseovarius nanhaiticus]SEK93965.1 Cro/C1-type HTH DNA-binding domain-containing protein [Roseovarius nanhaiticus]SIS24312.1 transcriptional regulator, XRE family [Roseovarius nanhaiticus]
MADLHSPQANRDADPARIRAIFGENLRKLSADYPSIAGLCRDLGINRTQFNRYLTGESFPRPDVLDRICQFFGTDARILLEPADSLRNASFDLLDHPAVAGFFGKEPVTVPEDLFPSGIYRFVRRSFVDETLFVRGLIYIHRQDGYTFLRGSEPLDALRRQGLSTARHDREFRGIVLRQEEGIMILVTHRNSLACSFNFLAPETSFQSNLWEGYVTRTVREKIAGIRAARMVYEHLGGNTAAILAAARGKSLVGLDDLPPFHARLLRLDQPFR